MKKAFLKINCLFSFLLLLVSMQLLASTYSISYLHERKFNPTSFQLDLWSKLYIPSNAKVTPELYPYFSWDEVVNIDDYALQVKEKGSTDLIINTFTNQETFYFSRNELSLSQAYEFRVGSWIDPNQYYYTDWVQFEVDQLIPIDVYVTPWEYPIFAWSYLSKGDDFALQVRQKEGSKNLVINMFTNQKTFIDSTEHLSEYDYICNFDDLCSSSMYEYRVGGWINPNEYHYTAWRSFEVVEIIPKNLKVDIDITQYPMSPIQLWELTLSWDDIREDYGYYIVQIFDGNEMVKEFDVGNNKYKEEDYFNTSSDYPELKLYKFRVGIIDGYFSDFSDEFLWDF